MASARRAPIRPSRSSASRSSCRTVATAATAATTGTGPARLADALPPGPAGEANPHAGSPAETTPFVRRSYERLELGAGVPPSALRFDDDATHHAFVLPPAAPDDTSYDELDVE